MARSNLAGLAQAKREPEPQRPGRTSNDAPRRSVAILDPDTAFRAETARLIDSQPDLSAFFIEGFAKCEKRLHPPDVVIIDPQFPNPEGFDRIIGLRASFSNSRILVLSECDEELFAERAVEVGASGYLMKENLASELLRAVRTLLNKKIYLSHPLSGKILQRIFQGPPAVPTRLP